MKKITAVCPPQNIGGLNSLCKLRSATWQARLTGIILLAVIVAGCTVKAVGDPERPITINANVVVDIRGLKQTASSIEDMVAKGGAK